MDDVISRQAAIDALGEKPLAWEQGEYEEGLQTQWESDVEAIKALPLTQSEPCEDAVSREAVLDALRTCYDTETITYDNGDEYIHYGDAVGEVEQLPPVTLPQGIDIDKASEEVLNAMSKWLTAQDDKRNVLDVIKDVLQPYNGKE